MRRFCIIFAILLTVALGAYQVQELANCRRRICICVPAFPRGGNAKFILLELTKREMEVNQNAEYQCQEQYPERAVWATG